MSVKHSQDVPAVPLTVGTGALKAVLISDEEAPNFAMRKFTIQSGGSMPRHFNLVEHEQYVLNGRAIVTIDDVPYEVQPGDVLFIPAEVPHSYQTIGEEDFQFLCLVPNKADKTILLEQ